MSGLSKVLGLPQVKLGWIVAAGPASARREALDRLEIIADTFLSVSASAQAAAARLLALRPALFAHIDARVRRNRAALRSRIDHGSPLSLLASDGGWSAILRLPRTRTEEEWALTFLEADDVLVHPGYFFDLPEEAYVIVSLLPEPEDFDVGVDRVARRTAG
jgi:aspartate/methionine/tyrosine aminotransferase